MSDKFDKFPEDDKPTHAHRPDDGTEVPPLRPANGGPLITPDERTGGYLSREGYGDPPIFSEDLAGDPLQETTLVPAMETAEDLPGAEAATFAAMLGYFAAQGSEYVGEADVAEGETVPFIGREKRIEKRFVDHVGLVYDDLSIANIPATDHTPAAVVITAERTIAHELILHEGEDPFPVLAEEVKGVAFIAEDSSVSGAGTGAGVPRIEAESTLYAPLREEDHHINARSFGRIPGPVDRRIADPNAPKLRLDELRLVEEAIQEQIAWYAAHGEQ